MEISNAHHLAMASHQLEEVLGGGCSKTQQQERKVKPQPEQALKCPRCESTNTKFCYYNNYSLSQPRYFCKGCRRYWTQGGSLRNVPVGGGCRKNKRCSSSSSSSKKAQDQALTTNSSPLLSTLPPLSYDPSDLTLAFARLHKQSNPDAPFLLGNPNPSHISTVPTAGTGFLDILRSGFLDTNTPSGFHNLYNGFGGSGSVGEAEGGMLPFEGGLGGSTTTTTATTVEAGEVSGRGFCKSMDGGENKVAMGLQWQAGGDGNNMAVDSARDYWNGLGSYWHGLINSSLM